MFQQSDPVVTQQMREAEAQQNALVPAAPEFRDTYIPPKPGDPDEPADKVDLFKGRAVEEKDAPIEEHVRRRHRILMDSMEEESERQSEERHQAQIDDDYYHHQQWKPEQAEVLMARGQAPLVFNEARGTIDWLVGTERRLRKDYKIRGREKNDEKMAELKTKAFKFVDDVNLGPWHRSRAFKDMVISGLGWIEEAINPEPDKELIFSGSEDWRRVFRDSRGREFDQSDWRYTHRRKIIDADYACALLPRAARHLMSIAGQWGTEDDEADDIWYLGEKLTSAHGYAYAESGDSLFGGDYTVRRQGSMSRDRGRRQSVELIETFYRMPKSVKVFAAGPLFNKTFNDADPRHMQLQQDRWPMYEAVKMQMHCMVSTKHMPCWAGPSPYRHGHFNLIPMFGYRRGRDGLLYGAMRGMRDPQDDLNKRRSKALYALSATRIIVKKGAVQDVEALREEAARVDALVEIEGAIDQGIKFEKFMGDVQGNMELAQADIEHIRNAGGVSGESLGHDTNAQSGRAIIAKQEQGSMVTYELFDNYFLTFKLAGKLRLSHIEQFRNQEWTFRLDPAGARPPEYVTVNQLDPTTGQYINDITASEADFIVDQQDYRATLSQAAMDSMFELLGQLATFAPMVVLQLLDLVVESTDISGKEEWVARIRKLTGQRDPTKPPTPEEIAAEQQQNAKKERVEAIEIETAQAKLDELKTKITAGNAARVLANLQALVSAVEVAATAIAMPGVAPAADALARSAGYEDQTPNDPIVPPVQAEQQPPAMGGEQGSSPLLQLNQPNPGEQDA